MKNSKNVSILLLMGLFQGMVFYSPVATLYRLDAGLGLFQISFIESICLLLTLVLEVPWGFLADRIGYRRTIVISSFLLFLSKIVFFLADSFLLFLLERVLLAIVSAGLSGVDSSMLYLSDKENAEKNFSRLEALGTLGMLTSALVYGLFDRVTYRTLAFLTITSHMVVFLLSFLLSDLEDEISSDRTDVGKIRIEWKSVLPLVLLFSIFLEGHHYLTVFLSQVKYEAMGGGRAILLISYVSLNLLALLSIFSSRLSSILPERRMVLLLCSTAVVSSLLIGLSNRMVFVLAAFSLLRISNSLLAPKISVIYQGLVKSGSRASELSLINLVSSVFGVGLNLLFGLFAEKSFNSSFFIFSLLLLLLLPAYMRCRSKKV